MRTGGTLRAVDSEGICGTEPHIVLEERTICGPRLRKTGTSSTAAIIKAFPYFVAQELNRPINSLAEADRVAAKYRTHLEQVDKEKNITNYSFDYYMRIRAEEQVCWQGTPSKALKC